jgi:uncharacterized protein (DUF58 family)
MNLLRQRKTSICLETWYYLVVMGFILAGAILREINLLIVLFGMMVGPLLYNWRAVIVTTRGLQVRRRTPEVICAGDLLVIDLEVTNTRRFWASWLIVAEDALRRAGDPAWVKPWQAGVLFSHIPPGATRKCAYQGRLSLRGRYAFGPVRLSTRFPLGLVRRTIVVDCPSTLVVYPRIGWLTPGWTRRYGEASHGSRRVTHRQGLMEGDYHGLRNYRPGDSRRWIHWRTSARRGELMVKQFEQQRNQDLCLLVDLWQPENPSPQDLQSVERAVSFAATITTDRCRRAGSYLIAGTATTASRLTQGPASNTLLQEIMEYLAVAEASPATPLAELLSMAMDEISAGTSMVLVTTRPVDLTATSFARLRSDARKKALLNRMLTIDCSSRQLEEYFQSE